MLNNANNEEKKEKQSLITNKVSTFAEKYVIQ
jgi:hypothetical protein